MPVRALSRSRLCSPWVVILRPMFCRPWLEPLPRARKREEIRGRLHGAAQGHVEPELDVEPIRVLLDQGCGLDTDILRTVARTVPELPRPLKSWGAQWLVREIMAAPDQRLALATWKPGEGYGCGYRQDDRCVRSAPQRPGCRCGEGDQRGPMGLSLVWGLSPRTIVTRASGPSISGTHRSEDGPANHRSAGWPSISARRFALAKGGCPPLERPR